MKISVIIPIYNAALFLEECLISVLNQRPHQIICVNDGSTDNSMEIVRQLQSEYSRANWVIIEQQNRGLGAARNAGLSKADGDYVAWLDADDIYTEKTFNRLTNVLADNPPWIVWSATEINEVGQRRNRFWKTVENIRDLLLNGNPYLPSACMLRLDVAQNHPFSEDRSFHGAEDFELWYRLFNANIRPTHVHQRLTIYRVHSSAMSQQLDDHLARVFRVLESLSLPPHLLTLTKKRKYYEVARTLHRRGMHRLAIKYYLRCRWWYPKTLALMFFNLFRVNV